MKVFNKMKIFLAIDSLSGGGAEKALINIANRLSTAGHEIIIVLTLGNKISYDVDSGVSLFFLNKNNDPRWGEKFSDNIFYKYDNYIFRIFFLLFKEFSVFVKTIVFSSKDFSQLIEKEKPDCVLSFLPNTNLITILSKKVSRWGSPLICSDRNFLSKEISRFKYSYFYKYFVRKYYNIPDFHVAVSDSCKDDLNNNFGVNIDKIETINNGVDLELIKAKAEMPLDTLKADIWPQMECLRVVSIGRLSEQKGHSILLHAIKRVNKFVPCRLYLIGEGELEARLKQISKDIGIDSSVYFLGWKQNPYAYLNQCDLFVLSSLWEGFPNVLLEAMAAGLPVLSTTCPSGPEEILERGKYGVLVPPGDSIAMAKAILRFTDPVFRNEQALLAQERCRHYSLKKTLKEYERLLFRAVTRQ